MTLVTRVRGGVRRRSARPRGRSHGIHSSQPSGVTSGPPVDESSIQRASSVLARGGAHSLDDRSIVQAVQIAFDQQGSNLQRLDPELHDLTHLSR